MVSVPYLTTTVAVRDRWQATPVSFNWILPCALQAGLLEVLLRPAALARSFLVGREQLDPLL